MKFYSYVRNSLYTIYCKKREKTGETYDRDIFMKGFLETVGTPALLTNLQSYQDFDMFWHYVELKEGYTVKLVLPEKYGDML